LIARPRGSGLSDCLLTLSASKCLNQAAISASVGFYLDGKVIVSSHDATASKMIMRIKEVSRSGKYLLTTGETVAYDPLTPDLLVIY
jgi:hypothetical protein